MFKTNIFIYCITNKVNGKKYIGQTSKTIEERFKKHVYDSLKEGRQQAIHLAIKKYGKENFEIKSLIRCNTFQESNHREAFCIKLYNSLSPYGYNLMEGGSNSLKSEESKKKMSTAQSGKKHWAYGKRGKDCVNYGRKLTVAHKNRISASGTGLKRTKRTCQNISNALKGKKHSPERINNMVTNWGKNGNKEEVKRKNAERAKKTQSKAVFCINNNTVYYSVHEAARQLGVFPQNIRKVLAGKANHTKGFRFRYA